MNTGYILTRSARYFSDRTAFVFDERTYSFGELNRRVNRLANALRGMGLEKGDRVGILFHNCPSYLEAYLGLYKSGLVWVRLNPRLSPQEILDTLEDAEAKALIYGPQFEETATAAAKNTGLMIHTGPGPGQDYEEMLARASEEEPRIQVDLDDLSDLWYTSGTTGAPKGIMLTHRNIMTCVQMLLTDIYDIDSEARLLSPGALSHAGSVRILPFMIRGASCRIPPRFEPERVLHMIEDEGVTDLATVPTMLIALLDQPDLKERRIDTLKRITYAGSPMPVERVRESLEVFGPVLDQSYGQAESIITITHLSRREHLQCSSENNWSRFGSAGREYPGVRIKVVDEEDREAAPGEMGEVVTRSDLVMKGYWKQEAKTAEAMRGGWLHTGDLGYLDEWGYLFLVDRRHDMIITGGLNVYPRQVEEVLARHPAVAQSVVLGLKDDHWGEAVTAAVVPKPGHNVSAEDLEAFCRTRLAGYKRPKHFHFLDRLPQNLYGKVVRKEVEEIIRQKGRRS